MRLNLGCGKAKIPDWTNVDLVAAVEPDQVVDLEKLPWPWPDDSVDGVRMMHVLEHLGATRDAYLGIIKELYRVCKDGAEVLIAVPHPRHDFFLFDPTHVRAITPAGLEMFSQEENRKWMAMGVSNTPLGIYLGVDFKIVSAEQTLSEPWLGRLKRGEITIAEVEHAAQFYNNVVSEYRIVMRAVKPAPAV